MRIFIPGNVPSSKNSKRWTGKILIHSKTTMRYIKESKEFYVKYKNKFLSLLNESNQQKPYRVSFKFIRGSKHKFDYVNPLQTVQDLMVKNGWLDDDNCEELIPVFEVYEYNKENPGVYIKILKDE